jgi:hypothetical protein
MLLAVLTGALTATSAQAQIYNWTDSNGNVHYGDQAPKDLPQLQPEDIPIPTAIPAVKIPPKPKENGPTIIVIGEPEPDRCSTKYRGHIQDGSTVHITDKLEEESWKACRRK